MKGSFSYKGFGHKYNVKIIRPLLTIVPQMGKPPQSNPLIDTEGTWVQVEILDKCTAKGSRFPTQKEKLKKI